MTREETKKISKNEKNDFFLCMYLCIKNFLGYRKHYSQVWLCYTNCGYRLSVQCCLYLVCLRLFFAACGLSATIVFRRCVCVFALALQLHEQEAALVHKTQSDVMKTAWERDTICELLADRTRLCVSVASVCRLSVCLWRYVLWLNGFRPRAKVTVESRIWSFWSRIWEIDWYQNKWPWPLFRGRLRSCQPLHHIRHWLSRKPFEIEAWFQKTTNRNGLGISNSHMTDDVTRPRKVKL